MNFILACVMISISLNHATLMAGDDTFLGEKPTQNVQKVIEEMQEHPSWEPVSKDAIDQLFQITRASDVALETRLDALYVLRDALNRSGDYKVKDVLDKCIQVLGNTLSADTFHYLSDLLELAEGETVKLLQSKCFHQATAPGFSFDKQNAIEIYNILLGHDFANIDSRAIRSFLERLWSKLPEKYQMSVFLSLSGLRDDIKRSLLIEIATGKYHLSLSDQVNAFKKLSSILDKEKYEKIRRQIENLLLNQLREARELSEPIMRIVRQLPSVMKTDKVNQLVLMLIKLDGDIKFKLEVLNIFPFEGSVAQANQLMEDYIKKNALLYWNFKVLKRDLDLVSDVDARESLKVFFILNQHVGDVIRLQTFENLIYDRVSKYELKDVMSFALNTVTTKSESTRINIPFGTIVERMKDRVIARGDDEDHRALGKILAELYFRTKRKLSKVHYSNTASSPPSIKRSFDQGLADIKTRIE